MQRNIDGNTETREIILVHLNIKGYCNSEVFVKSKKVLL